MGKNRYSPIGIFDSGIGGVSTLGQAAFMLPQENFVYFGDNGNGPYSLKTKEQVAEYCKNACQFLIEKNVKAIVVACNTATSVAISDLREQFDLPILGMEPAVKKAAEFNLPGKIVIMGTGMTLKSSMLESLIKRFGTGCDIAKLACRDVITMIEKGVISGQQMEECLAGYFNALDPKQISTVVFGCTHFGVLETPVKNIVGSHIKIADGNQGTVSHLKNILARADMINPGDKHKTGIEFYNSGTQTSLKNSKKNFGTHLDNLKAV